MRGGGEKKKSERTWTKNEDKYKANERGNDEPATKTNTMTKLGLGLGLYYSILHSYYIVHVRL